MDCQGRGATEADRLPGCQIEQNNLAFAAIIPAEILMQRGHEQFHEASLGNVRGNGEAVTGPIRAETQILWHNRRSN